MWWTRRHRARDGMAGRAFRPVSGPRACGRAVPKRTVKSCGSDASMVGVKSAEGKSARPGADEPVIRRRRGQESPIPRDEREISRKAIAQGMSDCLRCPVCSCALSFAQFAHEIAGAACIRHSLLPPFGGTTKRKPRAGRAARTRRHVQSCSPRPVQPGAAPRLRQRALIDVLPIPLPAARIPFGNRVLTMISVWLGA